MRATAMTILLAAVLGLVLTTPVLGSSCCPGHAAKAEVREQTLCPIEGGKIDPKVFADHDGKRVYFCCAGCIPAFEKAPEKYIKKLEESGVTLAKAPASLKEDRSSASDRSSSSCGHAGHDHSGHDHHGH